MEAVRGAAAALAEKYLHALKEGEREGKGGASQHTFGESLDHPMMYQAERTGYGWVS